MMMLLMGLLPIVIFVLLDLFSTPKTAISSSIATAIGMAVFYYFYLSEWDHSITAEVVLFIVLGAIALKMNNPKFFKFQPVVVGLLIAGFLGVYQIMYGPYLVKATAVLAKMSPEVERQINTPQTQLLLERLSPQVIVLFIVHSVILAWFVLKRSSWQWALWRASIWLFLFFLMIINVAFVGEFNFPNS